MDTETSSGIRKGRQVENARSYLDLCGNDPEPIIQQVITGDETIGLYFTPAKNRVNGVTASFRSRPVNATVKKLRRKIMALVYSDITYSLRDYTSNWVLLRKSMLGLNSLH